MDDLNTYFNVKATVIGIVFGVIALAIILGSARWYTVRHREGTGPTTATSAIPLAITRRAPWRTNRRQDTARSEALPAYGDTQNTTIVAPGDPAYQAASVQAAGTLLDFAANLSIDERIKKARALLAQAKLLVSGAPEGGYQPGSLEEMRVAELQRAIGLLMSVDAEKAAQSPLPSPSEGKDEAVRSSSEGARMSTACTQGHQGVLGEVEVLLDRMEAIASTGAEGAELDEGRKTKLHDLRRRIVEVLAIHGVDSKDLPPEYIPTSA